MRAPVLAVLLSCAPDVIVHAPVTVVIESPAPAPTAQPSAELERVLQDDAIDTLTADAGADHG